MSLSYTVQQAEAIVGDGRAKTGRGEVAKFFKPVLGDDALELSRVDRLVLKPVAMDAAEHLMDQIERCIKEMERRVDRMRR